MVYREEFQALSEKSRAPLRNARNIDEYIPRHVIIIQSPLSSYTNIIMSDALKRKVIYVVLAFGLGLLIFVGYRLLYNAYISMYAKEFVVGCIGSVITIFATAALLKSQSDSAIKRDQISGIFREKLNIYMEFINFLNEIKTDGKLTREELKKMVEWGSKLALFCNPDVIVSIYEYIVQKVAFGTDDYQELTQVDKIKYKKWKVNMFPDMKDDINNDEEFCEVCFSSIARIIGNLREDLAEKNMADEEVVCGVETSISALWDLHSVEAIDFDKDTNDIIITTSYDKPKPRQRRPRNTPTSKVAETVVSA